MVVTEALRALASDLDAQEWATSEASSAAFFAYQAGETTREEMLASHAEIEAPFQAIVAARLTALLRDFQSSASSRRPEALRGSV
jgi:hypothetical protein